MKATQSLQYPQISETALLVHVDFADRSAEEDMAEFQQLASSAGAVICDTLRCRRDVPDAKYFIGQGKAQEICDQIKANNVDVVLFNHALSPSQERNLERLFSCRVLDRIGLILDIFAQRAATYEGKLQVELAQLQHISTRLVRGWTHLERQKGGIGLRGPGETQLETDRRLIRNRIKTIHRRLAKVKQQRQQGRHARQRSLLPTVSIVGYTNAGKSTLFNKLSGAQVYVADQLFATLDPTLRQLSLPGAGRVVLTDTVGFIRHLPHDLVEAFSATLEETRDASLLLHVIDTRDDQRQAHAEQVNQVLAQINAQHIPQLLVYNKIDKLEEARARLERDFKQQPTAVHISAQTGTGLDLLKQAIRELLYGDPIHRTVQLTPAQGRLRAQLYALDAVTAESLDEHGNCLLTICIAKNDFMRLFPGPVANAEDIALESHEKRSELLS